MKDLIRHILKEETEELDRKVWNFLVRRFRKKKRKFGSDSDGFEPLEVIEYTFEDNPEYGFTSFYSKKDIERKIIRMITDNDVVNFDFYELDERDPRRIGLIKIIRTFLSKVLE